MISAWHQSGFDSKHRPYLNLWLAGYEIYLSYPSKLENTIHFYRPPGINQLEALDARFYQIAVKLKNNQNSTIILGGDFNAGHIDWATNSVKPRADYVTMHEKLITLLNDHHLTQLQKEPTRECSVLDLYCTNNPSLTKFISVIPGISDHDIVLVDSDIKPKLAKKRETES